MEAITKNLKLISLILVSAGLVFAYPLSVVFMNHEMPGTAVHHTPMDGKSILPAQPLSDSDACVDFHMNLLQKLSQSAPQFSNSYQTLALLVIAFLTLALLTLNHALINKRVHFQYQRLKLISLNAFFSQLGFWLIITHKKAPGYAFATA